MSIRLAQLLFAVQAPLLLLGSPAEGQRVILVEGGPQCSNCVIEFSLKASIGRMGDPAAMSFGTGLAADSRGNYFALNTYFPGVIVMYDSTGSHVKMFGKEGGGPGEFSGIPFGMSYDLQADTLHVFEPGRHSVVAPEVAGFVRSVPVTTRVWNSMAFAGGRSVSALKAGLHALAVTNESGEVLRQFGPPVNVDRVHNIRGKGDTTVWRVLRSEYRSERWSIEGELELVVDRRAEWFKSPPRQPLGLHRYANQSALQEGDSLLWLLTWIPDKDWVAPAGEIPIGSDMSEMYDSVLEVVDLHSGSLLASRRYDVALIPVLTEEEILLRRPRESEAGLVVLDILEAQLVRRKN